MESPLLSDPRVSVILCTYNNARFIEQAIDSILDQTYKLLELIVIDDGSTDNTRELLVQYMNRIHYIYQENQGASRSRNTGVSVARGEFIMFFDGDDYLIDREKVQSQVKLLDENPAWGLVMAGWQLADYDGSQHQDIKPWEIVPDVTLDNIIHRLPATLPSCLIRKHWFESVAGFNPKYVRNEDVDLLMRMFGAGCCVGWYKSIVFAYRMRPIKRDSYVIDVVTAKTFIQVWTDLFNDECFPQYILEQEDLIMFYKYQWAAFSMARIGQYDLMQQYLVQMEARSPVNVVANTSGFDWLSFVCYQTAVRDYEFVNQSTFVSYLLTMDMFTKNIPETIDRETYIYWWLDVWGIYHRIGIDSVDDPFIIRHRQKMFEYFGKYEAFGLHQLALSTLDHVPTPVGGLDYFAIDAVAYIRSTLKYDLSLVSVVIPTYNCASYLSKTLDSVLEQTYPNIEIIVIDDGSTDNTQEVLASYQQDIQYFYQDNHGASVARNLGITLAKGEYITFLDSDDYYVDRQKILLEVECLQANSRLGGVRSGWELVTMNEDHIAIVEPWHIFPQHDVEQAFYNLGVSTIMTIRTEWLHFIGLFDVAYARNEDIILLMRLLLAGCQFQWLNRVTFAYRQRSPSAMRDQLEIIDAYGTLSTWHQLLEHPNIPNSVRYNRKQILFFKHAYVVFELLYLGYSDDAKVFFDQMQPYMTYYDQPFYMVDFFAHVGEHLVENQFSSDDPVAQLLTILPDNLYWNLRLSPNLQHWVKFWLDVWWIYYLAQVQNVSVESLRTDINRENILQALNPYRHMPFLDFIKLVITTILNDPRLIDESLIDGISIFWEEMLSLGIVNQKYQNDILIIYLVLLLKSLRFRHSQADRYLIRKINGAFFNLRAIVSLGRFTRVLFYYFVHQR
jgi:glycosyltransferase involved in cell wall biosynthesis